MNITLLDHVPTECDALADNSAVSSFYHTSSWLESLNRVLPGFDLRCLVAQDGGQLRGYLPFFFLRTGPLRRAWSLPFGTYGGPVGSDEEVLEALLKAYVVRASGRNVIETGWIDYHGTLPAEGWTHRDASTQIVRIEGGFDHVWEGRVARDKRKRARKAARDGVTVERVNDLAGVEAHYRIYQQRVAAFGTQAPFPLALFTELFERGGERVRVFLARHNGEVVGAHFNFYHRDTVLAWYGMASDTGDALQAGTLLYAECMRDACESGYSRYNLGASLGRQSLIDYKASLGAETHCYHTRFRRTLLGNAAAAVRRVGRGR